MVDAVKEHIQSLVDMETKGWNEKNIQPFLSIIHPDMVWPFPPTSYSFDPVEHVFVMGRFNYERWRKLWQDIFDTHDLVQNNRKTIKIEVSNELDGALAVVDIDTLWRHKETKVDSHWYGRVGKIYTKMPNGDWKFISQSGALDYSKIKV